MSTAVTYAPEDLLADHDLAEPLVVNGVRCHGGFDSDGTYRSPRTLHRAPAIEAWETRRVAQFGTPALHLPLETWPEPFPNVAQTKLLLRHGVREPTIATLTRIGTVEGFGGMLRLLPIPEWQRLFVEDIDSTAIAHLGSGLFEAHARDEAGHDDIAGHDQMWFIARDIAFESPVTADETERMLERMGLDGSRKRAEEPRLLPDDIDHMSELVVLQMIGLLFIELSAFHSFIWAEEVLSDTDLVAGDGEAARLVSYIRADETPHVAYLRTAIAEMRDRTWVGASGRTYPGTEVVDTLWDAALAQSLAGRRHDLLEAIWGEVDRALAGRPDRDTILEEFWTLGAVRLDEQGRPRDVPSVDAA
ncbi:MAG: hypothetical protein JJU45_01260 [Acidimicrobiia bacterium]|nr:hypothetical protein [Acidimicrobiia bacterium]